MIVTVQAEAFPPRIQIECDRFPLYRVESDGTRHPILSTPVTGVFGFRFDDFDAPQSRPVRYETSTELSDYVVMPPVGVWLIPAEAPELGAPLVLEKGAFSGWRRGADRTVTEVPGRANAVAVDFTRKAASGQLKAVTMDPEDSARLMDCLNVPGPAFLSLSSSEWPGFERVSWVSIGDVEDQPQTDLAGRQVWVTTFDIAPVDRPELVNGARERIVDLVGRIMDLPGRVVRRSQAL